MSIFYLPDELTGEELAESIPERKRSYFPWGDPELEDVIVCPIHGYTIIDREHSWAGPGFAGGTIYHTEYRCGCNDHDESADLRAAI